MCVCIIVYKSSDNLPSYLPGNHHSSGDVNSEGVKRISIWACLCYFFLYSVYLRGK